jgi:chemotaxis protein CheX
MDVRYVNPFISAIPHVFRTMLNTDVVIGSPFLRKHDDLAADVSAIIGFSGSANGSTALCFGRHAAEKIASTLAETDLSLLHPDLADALGELANMVAGQAKARLDEFHLTVSPPKVVFKQIHHHPIIASAPILALSCDSAFGRFSVEVTMTPATNGSTCPHSEAIARPAPSYRKSSQ